MNTLLCEMIDNIKYCDYCLSLQLLNYLTDFEVGFSAITFDKMEDEIDNLINLDPETSCRSYRFGMTKIKT